jgi:inosine-uridine nucleoside N-ribohydrolase
MCGLNVTHQALVTADVDPVGRPPSVQVAVELDRDAFWDRMVGAVCSFVC